MIAEPKGSLIASEKLKLHIGSARIRLPGFINIDISPKVNPDLVADMCELPFGDGTVDEIYTAHTLEHIEDLKAGMKEMHRVLKKGGKCTIIVPYVACLNAFIPHHKTFFAWDSLFPFVESKEGNYADHYEDFHFASMTQRLVFHNPLHRLISPIAHAHPHFYECTILCHLFPAEELRFELIK